MKVIDLACDQQHVFEAWLASEADFHSQMDSGLLSCPMCGSSKLTKRLSAPRLNLLGHNPATDYLERADATSIDAAKPAGPDLAALSDQRAARGPRPSQMSAESHALPRAAAQNQAQLLRLMRSMVNAAEDVGEQFAEQARQMHYGDRETRAIRGRVALQEAQALAEEGVPLLPIPDFLKEPLH